MRRMMQSGHFDRPPGRRDRAEGTRVRAAEHDDVPELQRAYDGDL